MAAQKKRENKFGGFEEKKSLELCASHGVLRAELVRRENMEMVEFGAIFSSRVGVDRSGGIE